MGSLGIRDENLGKFWSRSWDGAKMWMASLVRVVKPLKRRLVAELDPLLHTYSVYTLLPARFSVSCKSEGSGLADFRYFGRTNSQAPSVQGRSSLINGQHYPSDHYE